MEEYMKNSCLLLLLCVCLTACTLRQEVLLLCTNDTHSQIEPCGSNMKALAGKGGYVSRMHTIDSLRSRYPEMLLLDAGDFSQGTPYFNRYKGSVEVLSYNLMGYDAVTLGNHEFDNGIDTLAERLKEAQFKVLSANYDVRGTVLEGIVAPAAVFERGGKKIGVVGVGVNPAGLILESNFKGIAYKEPVGAVNFYADSLKHSCGCDLVVVLSHLGSNYDGDEAAICDEVLAEQSTCVDIIVGGHTHKQVQKYCTNACGKEVLLIQAGKSGALMDKIVIR